MKRPNLILFNPDQWRGDCLGHLGHPAYAAEEPWFSMIDRDRVPSPAPIPENRELEPRLYQQMRDGLHMDGWSDVPATIEDLAGITPKHTHFGRSLMPVVTGRTDEHRDAVFMEGGHRPGEKSCRGLELIDDLRSDPQEVVNRIHDPGCAGILATLKDRMLRFHLETNDVVPLKVNAREAHPDALRRAREFNERHGME